MEIITKRPKGMPYRKYVEMRKASNNQIRRYLRFGRLYYLSAEIVTVETPLGKSPLSYNGRALGFSVRCVRDKE